MEILLSILIVVTLLLSVAVAFWVRWWTWQPLMHHRVLVMLDADTALQGIVISHRGPLLVLDDVTVITHDRPGEPRTSRADGTLVVERSRVRWVQVT